MTSYEQKHHMHPAASALYSLHAVSGLCQRSHDINWVCPRSHNTFGLIIVYVKRYNKMMITNSSYLYCEAHFY